MRMYDIGMKQLNKIFFRGLLTLLPIALTIYVLYNTVFILERFLGSVLQSILLDTYLPGMGLFATLALVFLFGLLLNNLVMGKILNYLENTITQIPFIRAIYSPLKDLMNLFNRADNQAKQKVIFVKFGPQEMLLMGMVTRENFTDLNLKHSLDDRVAVFFPFSYGLGGYTLLVQKKDIVETNLPIERAMSLAITGWVKAETKEPFL